MSCRARWETSTDGGAWRWGSFVVCCYHWATTRRTFRGEPNQGVCAIVCVCVCVVEQMAGCLNKWAYQMSGAGEYARFLTSYRKYTDIRVSSLLALICLLTSCRAVWQLQRNRFIYMIYCNCFWCLWCSPASFLKGSLRGSWLCGYDVSILVTYIDLLRTICCKIT